MCKLCQAMILVTCFATVFRLHRTARSSTTMFIDLLLVCLVNTTCAIINIMTTLIFIIVSRLHAFFLVVPIHSSLHLLVVVAVISYFQQGLGICAVDSLPRQKVGKSARISFDAVQGHVGRNCGCKDTGDVSECSNASSNNDSI